MLVSSEISVVIRKQRNLLVHISTTTNCGSIIKIIGASTTDLILPGQILEDSPVQRVVSGQDIKYKIFLEAQKLSNIWLPTKDGCLANLILSNPRAGVLFIFLEKRKELKLLNQVKIDRKSTRLNSSHQLIS